MIGRLRFSRTAVASAACAGMLAAACSLLPAQAQAKSFPDVYDNWFVGWVDEASDYGLMSGYPDTGNFDPAGNITRAEVATVFYRMATGATGNAPAPAATSFTDVATTDWFAGAVQWCKDNGIITGYPNGTFEPGSNVKRAELATMAYRFAQYEGADVSDVDESAYLNTEDDAIVSQPGTVFDYAITPFKWTADRGVLGGTWGETNGVYGLWLDAGETATRAQAAKIFTVVKRDVLDGSGSFIVSFNSNGGSAVDAQALGSGQKAQRAYPTRDGYQFDGWFIDEALTKEYYFDSDVVESLTLYAKWSPVAAAASEEPVVEEAAATAPEQAAPAEPEADGAAQDAPATATPAAGESAMPDVPAAGDEVTPATPVEPGEGTGEGTGTTDVPVTDAPATDGQEGLGGEAPTTGEGADAPTAGEGQQGVATDVLAAGQQLSGSEPATDAPKAGAAGQAAPVAEATAR